MLRIHFASECSYTYVLACVPLEWCLWWLSITWMYECALLIGAVYTIAGSAAQIVLTQVVARGRLVEAHAKNALATSGAEVAGPGLAGALIRVVGAPAALLVDACLLIVSASILRGIGVHERPAVRARGSSLRAFWRDL